MACGWYPIFLREMLLFQRKLFKIGYLFSAMVVPIIYLVTFGLGLGRNVQMQGTDYLSFLIPGLVAVSSMTNSYTWVASSLNLNRLYFKSFQVFIQAPVRPSAIMIGEVLAGIVKGLFASCLIIIVGLLMTRHILITPLFVVTLLLNCFLLQALVWSQAWSPSPMKMWRLTTTFSFCQWHFSAGRSSRSTGHRSFCAQ